MVFGALLTDHSKSFGCLSHKPLAAKLFTYGVKISSVRLTYNYLTNRRSLTKFSKKYSS